MSPEEVLLWVAAGFGVLILLSTVAFLTVLVWAAVVGLRRMSEEDEETEIFKSGGDR